MSVATTEMVRLYEALPEEKRLEVVDFARFLLIRTEHPDDLAWEARLADPRPLPKLEAFFANLRRKGQMSR